MPPGSQPAQQADWTRLVKAIHGAINRVSEDNIPDVAKALFRVNIFRGRGILCKTLLRVQLGSPALAPVLASLVAVLNTRVPSVIDLLVSRLVAQFRVAYSSQDRSLCFATAKFIASLYNQQVVSDVLVLEFLITCLLDPTDGSVELVVGTLDECAPCLAERSPKACEDVFERLREVLHDGAVSKRTQVMIERLMNRRRRNFDGQDTLDPRLDLVRSEEVITHFASLDDDDHPDLAEACNAFYFDEQYLENENTYEQIKRDILGAEAKQPLIRASNESIPGVVDRNDIFPGGSERPKEPEQTKDMTDAALVDFRRTVYLILSSGLTAEEWAHKIVRLMRDHPDMELELCKMVVECCSQERTFLRPYGILGERLCGLKKSYVSCFEETFATHYATIHRLDLRKVRIMANFYAFMLASDALPWNVLTVIRLVPAETTSSSRIFLMHLFQEMYYTLSTHRLTELFKSEERASSLKGLFPKDSVENAQFAINFFTKIGMGFLTQDLRDWLRKNPHGVTNGTERNGEDGNASSASSTLSSTSSTSSVLSPDSEEEEDSDGGRRPEREGGHLSPSSEHPSDSASRRNSESRNIAHGSHDLREGARKRISYRDSTSQADARDEWERSRFHHHSSASLDGSPSSRRTSSDHRRERERRRSRRQREWDYSDSEDDSYYHSGRYRQRRERKRRRSDVHSGTRRSPPRSRSPHRYSRRRLSDERSRSASHY